MIGLKRVLVPTDFSEASDAALRYGSALAGAFGATLYVMHVVDEPLHDNWAGYVPRASFLDAIEGLEAEARVRLEGLLPKEDVATGRTVVATVWGNATEQILKYAADRNMDLLVCGTHGRQGLDHLMMGSVAERLVRTASCPVLTVHHPEHEFVLPDTVADERACART